MSTPPFSIQDPWRDGQVEWARSILDDAVKRQIDAGGLPLIQEIARLGVPNVDDIQALCGRVTAAPSGDTHIKSLMFNREAGPERRADGHRHLTDGEIVGMTEIQRLLVAFDRAGIDDAFRTELLAMVPAPARHGVVHLLGAFVVANDASNLRTDHGSIRALRRAAPSHSPVATASSEPGSGPGVSSIVATRR